MTIFQGTLVTDSTLAGTIFGHATFQAGLGRAAEFLGNKFASIPGMGQVLSPGDRLVGSTALDNFPTGELTYFGTGWQTILRLTGVTATHGGSTAAFTSNGHGLSNGTPVVVAGLVNTLGGGIANGSTYYVVNVTTNTFGLASTSGGTALTLGGSSNDAAATIGMPYDKLPYAKGQIASGASNGLMLDATKYAGPIVAVDVIVVDLVGGGDLSYSIDGNATWTACGQSMSGGNGILRFRVMTPGMTTSLRVRCANASGTAVLGFPGGFRPWYIDHTTVSTGVIINDYGCDGQALHGFVNATVAGDHAAILDSVTLGTGNPLGNASNVYAMLHLNDVNYPTTASGTSFSADVGLFKTRVHPLGPIALIGCWEADPAFFDATVQATMRSTLAAAADSSTYYLDLNAAYANMGYSGNAAISAGGWLQDKIHLAAKGEADVGDRLFWFLRNGPLSTTIGGNVGGFTLGKSLLGSTDVFGGRGTFLETGTGAIVAGGTLAASGKRVVLGVGTIAAGGVLAAVGKDVIPGVGTLAGGGTLAATGTKVVHGTGAIVGDTGAPLHATGVKTAAGAGSIVGGGVLAALGSDIIPGVGGLPGGGMLAATGRTTVPGVGTAVGGGVLAAAGTRVVAGAGALTAGGVLVASGTASVHGAGTILGGGVLAGTGVGVSPGAGSGAIAGGGTLAGTGRVIIPGLGAANGGGNLAAHGVRIVVGSGTINGGGVLAGGGHRVVAGAGVVSGGGVLQAHGNDVIPGTGAIGAGGTLACSSSTTTVHGTGMLLGGGTIVGLAGPGVAHGFGTIVGGGVLRGRAIPPIVAFTVTAARDGWRVQAARSQHGMSRAASRPDLVRTAAVTGDAMLWASGDTIDWGSGESMDWEN